MKFKKGQIIAMILAVILLICVICLRTGVFKKISSFVSEKAAAVASLPTPSPTPALKLIPGDAEEEATGTLAEEEKVFTVDFTSEDLQNLYENVKWSLLDHQLISRDRERVLATGLSDAVSFPFKDTTDTAAMFDEVIEEILRSPIYGDMVARGLVDIKLSSGKTIGDLNPWLTDFIKKSDDFYSRSLDESPCGLECWLTYHADEKGNVDKSTIYVTKEYRAHALRLCVLLNRLYVSGVESLVPVKHFVLNDSATNELRRTEVATYSENRPALILKYTTKATTKNYEYIIGFNLTDKRIEIFGERAGGNGGDPTPTPTPTPTEEPGTKNPAADPYDQGNAPIYGGPNQPDDGTGDFQPTEPPRNTAGPIISDESSPTTTPPETVVTTTTDPDGTTATEFNKNPPPAEPIAIITEDYRTETGEKVVVDNSKPVSGVIALPD